MANQYVSKVVYNGQILIDLTSDTVVAEKLLSGYTAHGKDGALITGICTFDADTSDATVTESEILKDKIAYARGIKITGTMPNNGAITKYISTVAEEVAIPQGYHDGGGKFIRNDVRNVLNGLRIEAERKIPFAGFSGIFQPFAQ